MLPAPHKGEDDQAQRSANEETPNQQSLGKFESPAWIGSTESAFGALGFLVFMPFATVIGTQGMPTKLLILRFFLNFGLFTLWSCWLYQILRKSGSGKALNGWMLLGYFWMSFVAAGTCGLIVELLSRW